MSEAVQRGARVHFPGLRRRLRAARKRVSSVDGMEMSGTRSEKRNRMRFETNWYLAD
ncbi:hypothetical protein ALC62_09529 [Cyphomyrmex costatus]|uniref:Uncharacterized protein n=1 Tax=Cyphomyrmex costatus TaxID=456900 RepID=A0A195CIL6_9HYME|nr:hypothetical protein ALC62_09529 [Cyphomyrmex costatus]